MDFQIKIANKPIMIEIKDLHKSYGALEVLKGVSLTASISMVAGRRMSNRL